MTRTKLIVLMVMILPAAAGMVVMMMRVIMMMVMMRMIVMLMPVMGMIMMRVDFVGAAFRLERRLDHRYLGAERLQELLSRRRTQRAHAVRHELHRDVAIAEMPGDARQRRHIGGPRFEQRFRFGDDLDKAAVVERDDVVG